MPAQPSQSQIAALSIDAAHRYGIDAKYFAAYVQEFASFQFENGTPEMYGQSVDLLAKQWQLDSQKFGGDAAALASALQFKSPDSKLEQALALAKIQPAIGASELTGGGLAGGAAEWLKQAFPTLAAGADAAAQGAKSVFSIAGTFAEQPVLIPIALVAVFMIIFGTWGLFRAQGEGGK